jgi:hypothetical protein
MYSIKCQRIIYPQGACDKQLQNTILYLLVFKILPNDWNYFLSIPYVRCVIIAVQFFVIIVKTMLEVLTAESIFSEPVQQ